MSSTLQARPIGTRVFSLVGLGMVAPVLVLVWAGGVEHQELVRRARANQMLLASSAADRVSSALASGLEVVSALADQEDWSADPASHERLRDAVRRARIHHHNFFDTFFVFDADGRLVAGDVAGTRVDGRVVVEEARRLGRPGFSSAGPTSGDLQVVAMVPVKDPRGSLQLVVGARAPERSLYLLQLLIQGAPSSVDRFELRDGLGRRIVSSGESQARSPVDDPEVSLALSQSKGPLAGSCRECAGGGGAEWAAAPVGPAHWAVLTWQPADEATAFERQLGLTVALATVGLFGLALLFAWGASASVTRPLKVLTDAAERIRAGDLGAPIHHRPGDEVGALGAALEAMRAAVSDARSRAENLNAELEHRVAQRTRELREANQTLAARDEERTRLLRRVISAQEDERKRVARELHDSTSQSLAALSMGLEGISRTSPDSARGPLSQLAHHAAEALADVHRLILDLRPSVLDDLGLQSAIEWCADRMLRAKGISVRCEFDDLQRLSWELETAVFRAVQEALSNVARHAEADAVLIQVQRRDGRLVLEVEDDGRGFDPAAIPPPHRGNNGRGLGLLGMRERMEVLGGTVVVDSAPGQGTHVRLEVPIRTENRHG